MKCLCLLLFSYLNLSSSTYTSAHSTAFVMATVEKGQPTAVPDTEHDPNYGEGEHMDQAHTGRIIKGDEVELQDSDAWECLGYSFKTWRKW